MEACARKERVAGQARLLEAFRPHTPVLVYARFFSDISTVTFEAQGQNGHSIAESSFKISENAPAGLNT